MTSEENAFTNLTENIKFINEVFSNHFNKKINIHFKKEEDTEKKSENKEENDQDLLSFMAKTNSEIIQGK